MVKLSVNVNKVATLRNSRGGPIPSVTEAVKVCVGAGAPGITVHPRADERHIRREDVFEIAALLRDLRAGGASVEFNIEGDPRDDLVQTVGVVKADQCTLVPVTPGEITSHAGWASHAAAGLEPVVKRLQAGGTRVSLFVDPDPAAVAWAASLGADRIELYTEPFAQAWGRGPAAADQTFAMYCDCARRAHDLGLGVNAGHDLDLDNLTLFRTLPYLDEVSIGHALISRALFVGLDRAVRDYLDAVGTGAQADAMIM